MISQSAAETIEEQVKLTVKQGGQVVFGGGRRGAFFEPTVITNVTSAMDIARDTEVFGPVWPIIEFETVDEAIAIHNNSSYGLGGGVITRNMKTAFKVVREIKTGHVAINASGGLPERSFPLAVARRRAGIAGESIGRHAGSDPDEISHSTLHPFGRTHDAAPILA